MRGHQAFFKPLEDFQARRGVAYTLLPFKFIPLHDGRYIATNLAGEYVVIGKDDLYGLVRKSLPMHSETYNKLKARHFLMDAESTVALDLLAAKYRTKQAVLANSTSLFMFVTTLRCDHACNYCQVSRKRETATNCDMTQQVAESAVRFMFRSPSPALKVEFQGGESLLNFGIVKFVVLAAEEANQTCRKDLEFVITTNLARLEQDHLQFCKEHNVHLSTSLDGPKELHNRNRPSPTCDSYEAVIKGIRNAREVLGADKVSALMTATKESLEQPAEIVDEYLRQGFRSIFLRAINPYGYAITSGAARAYGVDEWLAFYRTALRHILEINLRGTSFVEEYSAIILRKMLTPFPTGYVDLQSPAGAGISCLVFNYDGSIYVSDEARMLAEMGDFVFRIGNLLTDPYEHVMLSEKLVGPIKTSMAEGVPMCADCGLLPYCGSDPVRHHAMQQDIVGFKPASDFCKKNMGVIKHLVLLLEDDERAAKVLRSWI